MNDAQTKTLMVVHIPKAAGTTLRIIIERQYPQIFTIGHDIPAERERLAAMPDDDKRQLQAVFGHMCWGWGGDLAEDQEYQYLTMLREPMERVLSLYAHCRLREHFLGAAVQGMDLHEFLTSGVTSTCDNGMVRQLCGYDEFYREPYADMMIPHDGVRSEHLTSAKANLDRCAVVGVAEDFDAMLAVCQAKLGWRIPAYENQNVTNWDRLKLDELDARTMEALEHYTRLDRELYEYVWGGGRDE